MMWLSYGLCHQLPVRSLFGGAYQVPVCARDTGIYIGFVASFAVICLLSRGRRPSGAPPIWLIAFALALISLMVVDGVTSYAGLRATTNETRLITGLFAGYGLALFIVPLLNGQLWRVHDAGRPLERFWQALVWMATIPLVYAAVWWVLPLTGIFFAVLVTIAILATFTIVNLVIVALFRPFENRAERARELWLPILIALALTLAELLGSAWFKAWLVGFAASLGVR